jgi:D-glycero-D-manno-heptose 1,7-bisphosphate phosphatase
VNGPLHRAVFLDRDGVLNEVVERDGHPASPRALDEFVPAPDLHTLQRLRAAGWLLFVITNQPDVSRGHTTPDLLDAMFERIRAAVPLDDVRACVHDDGHACACRKPRPGMIEDLARCWHVDTLRSYVIGDTWRDVEAARAAGCTSILLDRPYNAGVAADQRVATLAAAVDLILELDAA